MTSDRLRCTYILPIRAASSEAAGDLTAYLRRIAAVAETIVVDGSAPEVFASHASAWSSFVRHMAPAPDLATPMGKVGGVLTGIRLASHERIVIADDDVRYDDRALEQVVTALSDADVVRPQNYFAPMPWHARWDTGRTLLNRVSGGDWPGTLGVRRSMLARTGGYDGTAMFENLELVRTVLAAGGRERVLLDTFVERRPSTTRHFLSQRVRQAYDELARPARLLWQLTVLPLVVLLVATHAWLMLAALVFLVCAGAEVGRRRAGGRRVFPASAVLFAPLWIAERALCSWAALLCRVTIGGVPYRGTVLRHPATSMRALRARHAPRASTTSAPVPDPDPVRDAPRRSV